MSTEHPATPSGADPTADVRGEVDRLVREAFVATLATIDRRTGHPYASLVEVATTYRGRPLLLISRLAQHTLNLEADMRASLLFDSRSSSENPLTGPRVTLIGRMMIDDHPSARARFLRRHASAAVYAEFSDFAFWSLEAETAHFVGGFGRIKELRELDFLPVSVADGVDAEIAMMEEGLRLELQHCCAYTAPKWRICDLDRAGIDLIGDASAGRGARRLAFSRLAASVQDARELAENALDQFSKTSKT